ncbi:GDSL-type esterase/lipase family protein [Nocardia stercoris]|nr:GDSL-type esterase/lipase family protein [Nocardia stercoris]
MSDIRICFVGDSLVAGVGDRTALGWPGRLAARAQAVGWPLTWYNLGIRRETSADIAARWEAECARRLPAGVAAGVVFAFGANDTVLEDGRPRVEPEKSVANLVAFLDTAADRGWHRLVVSPPPNIDPEHNARLAELDARFAAVCAAADVGYLRALEPLSADVVWQREIAAGDGYHPDGAAYERYADLLSPGWNHWFTTAFGVV